MSTLLLPPIRSVSVIRMSMNMLENANNPRFKVRVNNLPSVLEDELGRHLVANGIKPERLDRIDFIVTSYEIVESFILFIHDSLLQYGYVSENFKTYTNPNHVSADFPKIALTNPIISFPFDDSVLLFAEYEKSIV